MQLLVDQEPHKELAPEAYPALQTKGDQEPQKELAAGAYPTLYWSVGYAAGASSLWGSGSPFA